jgi:hypothetical protein
MQLAAGSYTIHMIATRAGVQYFSNPVYVTVS